MDSDQVLSRNMQNKSKKKIKEQGMINIKRNLKLA